MAAEESIEVKVKFFGVFKLAWGDNKGSINLTAEATLNDLLVKLGKQKNGALADLIFTDGERVNEQLVIYINGTKIRNQEKVKLTDQDEVYLFLALSGG